MPRKRRTAKEKKKVLSSAQYFDLCLSRSRTIDKHRPAFQSALERRAAWYAHRGELMEGFGSGPGRRVGGWWAYECPKEIPREERDRPNQEEDWEILLALGEMDEDEKAEVLALWAKLLHLKQGGLRAAYDHEKQGIPSMHGGRTWDEECERWERQAKLLGPHAGREWRDLLGDIVNGWEEGGCSGCDYALERGHCEQKNCKHWKTQAEAERHLALMKALSNEDGEEDTEDEE